MMRAIQLAVACVAMLVATAGQVQAGIITYTDRTSFEANIAINQLIDFESLTGAQPDPLVIGDASFVPTGGGGLWATTGYDAPTVYLAAQNDGAIRIDIAPGTNAVGTDIGSLFGPTAGFLYDLEDSSGTVASGSFTAADNNSTFLGWTSDMGDLLRLTISAPTNSFATTSFEAIDNFTLGTANIVPEPSSLALFGIGACVTGVAAARRRRREKQQEATA